MASDHAELSSIHGSLERLAAQVSAIGDRRDSDPDDHVAPALFEVDRALRAAIRQIERIQRDL